MLDGEVVGVGANGRPLPFQVISSRTASSVDVAAGRVQTPLSLFVFDLLHVDGRDLLDEPLSVRAAGDGRGAAGRMLVPRLMADIGGIDRQRSSPMWSTGDSKGWW